LEHGSGLARSWLSRADAATVTAMLDRTYRTLLPRKRIKP
jgi:hypothetical protein